MEINNIAALATGMAAERTGQAVGIAVLCRALDAQTAAATELLEAIPQPPSLPAHLGQNINTTA